MNATDRQALLTAKQYSANRTVRLWCKSQWRDFDVMRVPVEALLLNPDNRRFKAEKKLMEAQLGRALDPENNPTDELSVISILLDADLEVDLDKVVGKRQKSYDALERDWLNRSQESPFWIRPDGLVRNGNRRLAMIKRLTDQQGADWSWVDAIILDVADVDEQDLFEMEQREQLTENLKVRYTDINLLLTLREAALAKGIDWADPESIDRVAGELQSIVGGAGDKAYAAIQLRAIRYIDEYLVENNAPGEYHKLIGTVERFRDVGKMMETVESNFPEDAADVLRMAFAAITAKQPHGTIRQLRKMFINDRERFYDLLRRIDAEEQKAGRDDTLPDPDLSTATEGDADEDQDRAAPPPTDTVVARLIDDSVAGFAAANALDVVSLIIQAADFLATVAKREADVATALAAPAGADVRLKLESIRDTVTTFLRLQ